jgi:arylsulfatase A-like enzyme
MLHDLHPTILDAVGVEAETDTDGRSLLPLLEGPRPAKGEPRTLLFQTDWQSRCQARAIIRDGHS